MKQEVRKKETKVVGVTQMMKKKMKKEGGGGVNFIGEDNFLVAKVKNTVKLQPSQGKWIPLSYNLSQRNDNDFLYPVLFNTIIERNLVVSKFSPKAGVQCSTAMYIINNNDIFVQVRKGESPGRIVQLEMRGITRTEGESRGRELNPHPYCS